MTEDNLAKIPGQCVEVIANTAKEVIETGKSDIVYHFLNSVGLHKLVEEYKQQKMVKKIVDQISNKIDQATQEIIGKVVTELRDQNLNNLIGKTHSLQRALNNYYDSPNKDRLDFALGRADDLTGSLISHLNNPKIDDDVYYLTRIFSLYVVAVCLYCMIQFECISRYAASEEERKAISTRVANEIEQATTIYNNISDRLYKNTINRFSNITERLHEPWTNWLTWFGWRTAYYVYEFEYDGQKIEAKAVKCKIYPRDKYEDKYGSRTDKIMKTTIDGGHFVWESSLSKSKALREAENIRTQKIKEVHNDNYGNFVRHKGSFESSIKPYQNIFITKNTS
jgi:hypothetical protein